MRRQKNKEVKVYKQTVVNTVILVVVLVLFVYVAIQMLAPNSTQVSTQRTQLYTDTSYFYLDGIIFKDASAATADGDIIRYLVDSGEKVGVGQAYAEVYSGVSLSKEECASVQQRLNKLSDRIKLIEDGLESGKNAADLGAISDKMDDSYYAYINAVLGGSLSNADKDGGELLGALVDYSSVTLSEAAENTLAELTAERDALLLSIGGSKTTLVSDRSFTFSRRSDGYENLFNTSSLESLSRESLDALMLRDAESVDMTFGSRTYSSKWYLAIPTDTAGYVTFSESVGSVYEIEFSGAESLMINMTLERAVADGEGSENSYLLFSSFDLLKIEGLDRRQSVRVKMDSLSGYRVPSGAIHTLNGELGVYILVGNMIEFRRTTPIGEGDGYYIVNTYEKDLEEASLTDTPYLGINDLIITSGRDLYDGKLLD